MNNPLIYQVVGGLTVVFFLVLIYYFTKSWRWYQILTAFGVFAASIALLCYSALVYRTHNAWRSLEARSTAEVEKLSDQLELLRHGDLVAGDPTKDETILALSGKIGRSIIDLGRVWRNCTPQGIQDGAVLLSTIPPGTVVAPAVDPAAAAVPPPADPAAAGAAAPGAAAPGAAAPAAASAAPARPAGPPPNKIEKGMILYVFLEDLAPPITNLKPGTKVPRYYLGEFLASAATDTTVTITPVFPLSPVDQNVMRQPNLTWSLYETLPVDGHELFSKTPEVGGDLNASAQENSVFGDMDPALLQLLLPAPQRNTFEAGPAGDLAFQIATQRHAATLKDYLRDGLRASNDDPPLNVWLKIRFKEKYSEVVDSGAKVSALQLGATDDFFDRGLAEVAMLQRGSKADFEPGDVAVFPQEDGNRLLQERTPDGKPICELIEPVYARTLNHYAYLFRDTFFRHNRVLADIARISRDIGQIQKARQHIVEQQTVADSEQAKLNSDIAKTNYEKTKIAEYLQILEKSVNEMKAQLSLLYRSNVQLEADLERAHERLTSEINRRNRAVAGAQ